MGYFSGISCDNCGLEFPLPYVPMELIKELSILNGWEVSGEVLCPKCSAECNMMGELTKGNT